MSNQNIEPGCLCYTYNCRLRENNGKVVTVIGISQPPDTKPLVIKVATAEVNIPLRWENFNGEVFYIPYAPIKNLMRIDGGDFSNETETHLEQCDPIPV